MTDDAPPVAVLSYHGPADGDLPGRRWVWLVMGILAICVVLVTVAVAGLMGLGGAATAYGEAKMRPPPSAVAARGLTVAEVNAVLAQPSIAGSKLPQAQLDALAARLSLPGQQLVLVPPPVGGSYTPYVRSHTPTQTVIAGSAGFRQTELVLDPAGRVVEQSVTTYSFDGLTTATTDGAGVTTTAFHPTFSAGRGVRVAADVGVTLASCGHLAAAGLLAVAAVRLLQRSPASPLWCRRYAVMQWVVAAIWAVAVVGLIATHSPPGQPVLTQWQVVAPLAVALVVASAFPAVLWWTIRRPA